MVTGWKITEISGGTPGTYTAADNWGGYNFADRNCTNKDLYTVSKRVFAQGAYYDVPNGVTSITIEPYWAKAAYVSDRYYDVVYSTAYVPENVVLPGVQCVNESSIDINGSSQTVYTTIDSARASLGTVTNGTVYDLAVVLVGNVHQETPLSGADIPYTIMSADLDFDNEPDYSFIFSHDSRQVISPIRFDFLNVPGTAMAQKPNGATLLRNVSLFKPKGWFEVTNTCVISFGQFEYDNGGKGVAPLILLGGSFDQFASTQSSEPQKTTYIHLGSNVWFKEFGNGTHSDGNKFTPHIPISVTGGEYEKFYLSGTYRPDAAVKADNAECYVSGGRFGEMAGAAMQQINGNVGWQIDHAEITDFYGGGINAAKPVTGNITVEIKNSVVGTYCGGPKFGDMAPNMTVTTTADSCTFGLFFGAGYGGTSYNRVRTRDATEYNFTAWQTDYTKTAVKGKYSATNGGVASDFDYDFFVWSSGVTGGRFYVKYASFSLAKTNDVSSTLNNCTITQNYYGGGNLGEVAGNATSVLNNCTVAGNVFGAGYSATIPTVPFRNGGFTKVPKINPATGFFESAEFSDTTHYTWAHVDELQNGQSGLNTQDRLIYTDVELTALGKVTGNVTLTINGGQISGGIFGGGDESGVDGNTDVILTSGTIGNGVYGGCNSQGTVGGNTCVTLKGGTVGTELAHANVHGGGYGVNTSVSGNVYVKMGESLQQPGTATVYGDVYGGSALGQVNDELTDSTCVLLYGGTINGDAYGGGLGHLGSTPGDSIAAWVNGNVRVQLWGSKFLTGYTYLQNGNKLDTIPSSGRIFGANNQYGSPKGSITVKINNTVPYQGERQKHKFELKAVYGGGNMAPYMPTNPAQPSTVIIDGCGEVSIEQVYGGGNAAPVPATEVIVYGSYDIDDVFGGGNGKESIILQGVPAPNPGADVGIHKTDAATYAATPDTLRYNDANNEKGTDKYILYGDTADASIIGTTNVTIYGGNIHQVFGGSNTKGDIIKEARLILGHDNLSTCDFNVDSIYGGSNEAYMSGSAAIDMRCITSMDQIFGGSKKADVNGDINLTITGGTYGKVFGGNNISGRIFGSITVNIEQTGCVPIIIGELYGGGNQAPYSIYGYDGYETCDDGIVRPVTIDSIQEGIKPFADPQINIISCQSIGTVYGGGYQAKMVGSPHVNINMIKGWTNGKYIPDQDATAQTDPNYEYATNPKSSATLGVIGTVYGGGNMADVVGDTYVNIGTQSKVTVHNITKTVYTAIATGQNARTDITDPAFLNTDADESTKNLEVTVEGAIITGNVYGGGNQADVTGCANIQLGPPIP